jgi:hypothetical protein
MATKYIAQPNGSYAALDTTSELYTQLSALPTDRRPVFLPASDEGVKAFFAAQTEAAKVKSVTARQGHEALIRQGLYDNVVNAINGIEDAKERQLAYNWFERSNTFNRDNATLIALTKTLNLTSGDVDNLFAFAATL